MKLLETDWAVFVEHLRVWAKVPPPSRSLFLTHLEPALSFPASEAADALQYLVEAGILVAQGRGSVRVAEDMRSFARVLRALHRYPVFDPSRPVGLAQYLADHFSYEERVALGGGELGEAAMVIGTKTWLQGFLDAKDLGVWERAHQGSRSAQYFPTEAASVAARELVRQLSRRGRPLEMARVAELEIFRSVDPQRSREWIATAVGGAIRYCLLFPALRTRDGEPVIGVWPGLVRGKGRRPPPTPTVRPAQSFHAPILIHDMSAVLVECAGSPVVVRRSDLGLFARTVDRLSPHLYPLPAWCEPFIAKTASTRLRAAQLHLHASGYIAVRNRGGEGTHMSATDAGRTWLTFPIKQRIRAVLDHLTATAATEHRVDFLPAAPQLLLLSGRLDLRQAVCEVFRALEPGVFVEYRPFLRGALERLNPYLELRHRGVRMSVRGLDGYREPTRKELEEQWEHLVERFLAQRLLVLDGVEVGITAERHLCFSLTQIGRCLLGYAEDFDYAAEIEPRVVVQPNFEVVFLSASASAEAVIGTFAERVGREVGTLFRITRQSVLRAASTGVDQDGLLASLKANITGPIPPNVEAEIKGWLDQVRRVRLESALLIRLPDAETTARAVSAGGKLVRPVSDTVLEVVEPRRRLQLERRLAEEGIFLDGHRPAPSGTCRNPAPAPPFGRGAS